MTTDGRRGVVKLTRALGAWPWLALCTVVLGAVYTRAAVGHWPVVFRDDPKGLFGEVAVYSSLISLIVTTAVAPFAVVALVIRRVQGVRPTFDKWIASAFVGTLVFGLIARADPFGYLTWLFD